MSGGVAPTKKALCKQVSELINDVRHRAPRSAIVQKLESLLDQMQISRKKRTTPEERAWWKQYYAEAAERALQAEAQATLAEAQATLAEAQAIKDYSHIRSLLRLDQ